MSVKYFIKSWILTLFQDFFIFSKNLKKTIDNPPIEWYNIDKTERDNLKKRKALIKLTDNRHRYAVLTDREDNDWGTGSFDYNEAVEMAKFRDCTIIAVIDGEECIDEITDF